MNMDLLQIGGFLKQLRTQRGLTQEQLGAQLGVSNKTVSRWETGTYLPPVEMLQALSEFYGVSINELLSGKRLSQQEYQQAAEYNLKDAMAHSSFSLKERQTYFKKKWLREHWGFLLLLGLVLVGYSVYACTQKDPILVGCIPLLACILHGIRNNTMMAYVEQHTIAGNGVM